MKDWEGYCILEHITGMYMPWLTMGIPKWGRTNKEGKRWLRMDRQVLIAVPKIDESSQRPNLELFLRIIRNGRIPIPPEIHRDHGFAGYLDVSADPLPYVLHPLTSFEAKAIYDLQGVYELIVSGKPCGHLISKFEYIPDGLEDFIAWRQSR